jgi:hypothetical protein
VTRALVIVAWIAGVLAVSGLAAWLMLFGGLNVLAQHLPPGVWTLIGEKPGAQKIMPQKGSGDVPWRTQGAAAATDEERGKAKQRPKADDDEPEDEAAEPAAEAPVAENAAEPVAPPKTDDEATADRAMAPVRALSGRAEEAIQAYEEDSADQALYHAAEKAVESLRSAVVAADSDALKVAATELRNDLALKAKQRLEQARLAGRATHRVFGTSRRFPPGLDLHKDTNKASKELGRIAEGVLVRVHIDAGSGWVKCEAMTGEQVGLSGYALAKYLRPLKRKKPVE